MFTVVTHAEEFHAEGDRGSPPAKGLVICPRGRPRRHQALAPWPLLALTFWPLRSAPPTDHAKGQGCQHGNDDGGVGSVYAGLAQLFRILRNARSAGLPHPLGPVATTSGSVAAVENTAPSPGSTARTGGTS